MYKENTIFFYNIIAMLKQCNYMHILTSQWAVTWKQL